MPEDTTLFTLLKAIHMMTLIVTLVGFITRAYWMLNKSPLLQARIVKTLPHINDTLLLLSALGAAALIGQYPFVNAWLTAKVLGAVAYILLGAVALHYGPTLQIRLAAFVGALLSFGYVVAVAATKNPLIF